MLIDSKAGTFYRPAEVHRPFWNGLVASRPTLSVTGCPTHKLPKF